MYKPDFRNIKLGKPVVIDMDMSAGDFLALFYLLKVPVEVIDIKVEFVFCLCLFTFSDTTVLFTATPRFQLNAIHEAWLSFSTHDELYFSNLSWWQLLRVEHWKW